MLKTQQLRLEKIAVALSEIFRSEIEQQTLKTENIRTLSQTLSRVDDKLVDDQIENKSWTTAQEAYSWAIAHADIVFPYLSLRVATEKIKSSVTAPREWGPQGEEIRLPKRESVSASPSWSLINELSLIMYGDEKVHYDFDCTESVPTLDLDETIKNPAIEHALVRILELRKSPLTATIRRGLGLSQEDMIKNAVDFIILEKVYQERQKDFGNLSISADSIKRGRRIITVRTPTRDGRAIESKSFRGYILSDYLRKYQSKETSNEPEGEPFFRVIYSLITKILTEDIIRNYTLPKTFLEPPAQTIRSGLRRGPNIRTKTGLRTNLYTPFSYAKSSECQGMPEVIRKELTHMANEVVTLIDQVNNLSIEEANGSLPLFKEYIRVSYSITDEIRKEWRTNINIPPVDSLRKNVVEDIAITVNNGKLDLPLLKENLHRLKVWSKAIPFTCAYTDRSKKDEIISSLKDLLKQRSNKRLSPRG
jgi:hypothetical protein